MEPPIANNSKYQILQPLLLSLMMIAGIALGYKINAKDVSSPLIQAYEADGPGFGRVEEVLRFLENKYVDTIDQELMVAKAIQSMISELDPHSVYIQPEELEKVNRQMAGNFFGIGIETLSINDTFVISYILDESPAGLSGLKLGDQIISINDSLVAGKNLSHRDLKPYISLDEEIAIRVRGAAKGAVKTVKLIPNQISLNSAKNHFAIDDQSVYLELARFTSVSYKDFMKALESMAQQDKPVNLVLDLRNNPGGYLPETNKILSQFFKEKDKLLLYTQGNNGKKQEYKSNGKVFFEIDKIITLIDEGSASGAEILAGSLQDWDRGIVIGRRSFGKGLVQEQFPLSNGAALRLTVARYYTPSGRSIQKPYIGKSDYHQDLEKRALSGELSKNNYRPDSLLTYKTKALKRKVFGGGGVSPDIFIAENVLQYEPIYGSLVGQLRVAVLNAYVNGQLNCTKENIVSRKCDHQAFFDRFLVGLTPHLKGEYSRYKSLLEDDYYGLVAKYNFNSSLEKQMLLQNDKVYLKALEMLAQPNMFEHLD